jgi:hypothetical protein
VERVEHMVGTLLAIKKIEFEVLLVALARMVEQVYMCISAYGYHPWSMSLFQFHVKQGLYKIVFLFSCLSPYLVVLTPIHNHSFNKFFCSHEYIITRFYCSKSSSLNFICIHTFVFSSNKFSPCSACIST